MSVTPRHGTILALLLAGVLAAAGGAARPAEPMAPTRPAAGLDRAATEAIGEAIVREAGSELQALIGLRDAGRILDSARARRLYARGEPVAGRAVRAYDTGAWSLYS